MIYRGNVLCATVSSSCYLRARCSLWCLSCSSSFTENMDEPSMYIYHIKTWRRWWVTQVWFLSREFKGIGVKWFLSDIIHFLPCPGSGPWHHRLRAWPESAGWSESPERTQYCWGRWGYWSPGGERERGDVVVLKSPTAGERKRQSR